MIHKVQGKTMEKIVACMGDSGTRFMPGQAYMAFSRVKTLDGLFLKQFNALKIRCSPAVREEMKRLRNCQSSMLPISLVQQPESGVVLKIGFLTVRCYLEYFLDLQQEETIKAVHCMCFVETFLHLQWALSQSEHINTMDVFRADRVPTDNLERGGGVMIVKKVS